MDKGNEEEIDYSNKAVEEAAKIIAKVQSDLAKVAESTAPMLQQMAESMSAVADAANIGMNGLGGEIHRTQRLIADLTVEDVRHESEAESRHIQVEEAIINQLNLITSRLDKLENKPPQPSPELDALKKQVASQNMFLEKHRETIEDLHVLKESKRRQWIHSLDKKEANHDDR